MRIGVFIHQLEVGGAEKIIYDQLRIEGQSRELQFIVIVLRSGGFFERAVREFGWPIVVLDECHKLDISVVPRLVKVLRQWRIDLLHTHLPRPASLGRLAACIAGVPTLYTEHSEWSTYPTLSRWLNFLSMPMDKAIVAVSHAVKAYIVNRRPHLSDRISVIYNGVDMEEINSLAVDRMGVRSEFGFEPTEVLVLNVANLHPRKNHKDLIRAIAIVNRDSHNPVRLLIVGRDDGERKRLEALTTELGLHNQVHFAGPRNDVIRLITASDIFVLSSLAEGLPVALLEAAALAHPCVATRVGGIPEVISENERGWLVEVANPVALANALIEALSDRSRREKYGRAAQAWVQEHFTIQRMASEYRDLYYRLVGR
jgi:glycosyltransferase involved in cell wall biosynthesis